MKFNMKNLGVLAHVVGFTHWLYRSDDEFPVDHVQTWNNENFFGDVSDMLSIGDLITVTWANPRPGPFMGGPRLVQVAVDGISDTVKVIAVSR